MLRRLQPAAGRERSLHRRLVRAVVTTSPDIIYAVDASGVAIAADAAGRSGAAVMRQPSLPCPGGRDIVELAPTDIRFSSSPSGRGSTIHTPADGREPWFPLPGRHRDLSVVVAARETATNPARYLRSAMERAGIHVHATETLDWSTFDQATAFVVVVESPYPALDVVGANPGIPVLFWAHHGEHHTDAHLRLIERYGADAVLLAHSWHLAHRYPVPVHRFPFAVAPELAVPEVPWDRRRYDVAFVGRFHGEGDVHRKRRRMLESIAREIGEDRTVFREDVAPEDLAAIYADARVVVNEGGARHHPITMRVFEAVGAGSTLVTTRAPGIECLFEPSIDYVEAGLDSMAPSVMDLIAGNGRAIARRGAETAAGRHTYDHRVDELVMLARGASHRTTSDRATMSAVGEAIMARVDIGSIGVHGNGGIVADLPHHAIWLDPVPGERTYDAVVLAPDTDTDHVLAIGDGIRYVVVSGDRLPGAVASWVAERGHVVHPERGCVVIDLGAAGYRIADRNAS
jgi:Glycosyl transferases group 1